MSHLNFMWFLMMNFTPVTFMREGTIPPNWKDFVQISSQSGVPDNIGIRDDCLTPYIEEDPRETPTHVPIVASENNRNTIISLQSVQQV